jgi:hypothetical protein
MPETGKVELLKVVAMPLVTLIVGFGINQSLNTRQARENNLRLYTDMMGRREEADTALRKDMFNSILATFMQKDSTLKPEEKFKQQILDLELLAYNFHDSLDVGPLFKDVRRTIAANKPAGADEMMGRLEKVAVEVNSRQLAALSDSGTVEQGDVLLAKVKEAGAFIMFGPHVVADKSAKPGEVVNRLCLSLDSGQGARHYRQFKLEVLDFDPSAREVQFRMYVSKPLSTSDCQRFDLPMVPNREIDTRFWVGLFDFPMIDNTRLTLGERCAVAITALTPDEVQLSLAYFPGSRASLKDKPYYDELMHDLLRGTNSPNQATQ